MKKGAGLVLLAIASVYQLNKINNTNRLVNAEVRKRLIAQNQVKSTRKSPVEVLKEQLKLKEDLRQSEQMAIESQSEELVEVNPVSIESAKPTETETDDQVESGERILSKSFKGVEAKDILESLDSGYEAETAEPTIVYLVGKSQKYHLTKECRGLKKDSKLTELTLEDAVGNGYSLCGWENKQLK